ncbi:hypothetical protein PG991_003890 [Apiospora marii]|uniref:F-box domain-containing protein n=1 Tax=Apiospora marii TaxID=335849 RepID=A0ABR1S6G9_9PEZI
MAEIKKPKGWFDLPPEIRNAIYRELLTVPESEQHLLHPLLNPKYRRLSWRGVEHPCFPRGQIMRPLPVAILRTNKRVRAEAAGILYGENVMSLVADDAICTAEIFRTIGRANDRHIRRVVFDSPCAMTSLLYPYRPWDLHMNDDEGGNNRIIALLAANCPNLIEITIGAHFDGSDSSRTWRMVLASQTQVVSKMDAHLRAAFPSLRGITVKREIPCRRGLYHWPALAENLIRDHRSAISRVITKVVTHAHILPFFGRSVKLTKLTVVAPEISGKFRRRSLHGHGTAFLLLVVPPKASRKHSRPSVAEVIPQKDDPSPPF